MMTPKTIFGHRVKQGKVQRIRVEYASDGRATVTPLGAWRPVLRGDCLKWAAKARKAAKS